MSAYASRTFTKIINVLISLRYYKSSPVLLNIIVLCNDPLLMHINSQEIGYTEKKSLKAT